MLRVNVFFIAFIGVKLFLSRDLVNARTLSQSPASMTSLTFSNPTQMVNFSSSTAHSFCFSDYQKFRIGDVFREISIEVMKTSSSSGAEFPWFSVRGVSTDDFHENLENVVFNIVRAGDDEGTIHRIPTHQKKSVVRDFLSSCPNPIFSSDRSRCKMTFSPFGEACVTIHADRAISVVATLHSNQNPKLILRLLCGVFLLYLAHPFSKSKIFQYLAGVVVFILGGLLITGLYCGRGLLSDGRRRGGGGLLSPSTGIVALLTGTYGASAIWFLRTNFRSILLSHWEFTLGYILFMALSGLVFTYFVRKNESLKHYFRVSVKWLIRISGAVVIYNASASPMVSMSYLIILSVVYVSKSILKFFARLLTTSKTKRQ